MNELERDKLGTGAVLGVQEASGASRPKSADSGDSGDSGGREDVSPVLGPENSVTDLGPGTNGGSEETSRGPVRPPALRLSARDQRLAVDRGDMAACGFCGVLTWADELEEGGLCRCGMVPYVRGGPLPDITLGYRGPDTAELAAADLEASLELATARAEGMLPDIGPLPVKNAAVAEVKEMRGVEPTTRMGRMVYSLRENLGYTQEDLAKALGCHVNTVYNLEAGHSGKMQTRTRLKFAAAASKAGFSALAGEFMKQTKRDRSWERKP